MTTLPTVRLGGHEVSRLIIGGNPFSGNSHFSAEWDNDMLDYFTTENIKAMRATLCSIPLIGPKTTWSRRRFTQKTIRWRSTIIRRRDSASATAKRAWARRRVAFR